MSATVKEKARIYYLPEGRVINHALFERDAFQSDRGAPGKAKYKIEIAFDPEAFDDIRNDMADFLADNYGQAAGDKWFDTAFPAPLLDGNVLAANRAEKGKEGDAYKGKIVIRADTTFNKDGEEGPGGAAVHGPDTALIGFADKDQVYAGCYGILAVTFSAYKDYPRHGDRALKCYIKAFQKTRDGERIQSSGSNTSSLFKPVAGAVPQGETRRRRGG